MTAASETQSYLISDRDKQIQAVVTEGKAAAIALAFRLFNQGHNPVIKPIEATEPKVELDASPSGDLIG